MSAASGPDPTPIMADRDSAPWWRGLSEHRVLVQRCAACSRLRWAPRGVCGECGSVEFGLEKMSGEGTIVSWVVSHRTLLPDRPAPYAVVLVRLVEADDIMIPGGWAGALADLAVGVAVRAEYEDRAGSTGEPAGTLLRWVRSGPC